MKSVCGKLMLLFGVALLQPLQARAAVEVPVKAFPSDTSVVIRLADPTATIAKVGEMASGIDPTASTMVQLMGAGVGQVVDNPAKQGIKPKTDWWIAVIANKQGPPTMVYAVQATDLATLKDAVGDRYEYVTYDNWTVYTRDAAVAKTIADCAAGKTKSIEAAATEETKSLFADSDIAVFVNLAQLKLTYSSAIDQMRDEVHRAMEEAESNVPEVEGLNMSAVLGMYTQMFDGILAAIEDSNSLTSVINIETHGVKVRDYLEVKSGSKTDKLLQIHKPAGLASLTKLPSGQLGYFGFHGDMQAITKWSFGLVSKMFDVTDDQKTKFAELEKEIGSYEYGDYVMGFGLGTKEAGYMNAAVISEVKNAKNVRQMYLKSMEVMSSLGQLNAGSVEQSFEFKQDAEKIGDLSVDQMIVKQEINEELDPLGIQKQIINAMYGPEGAVSRVVYTDNAVIQSTGGGKAFMEKVLAAWNSPSPSEAMTQTRSQLAADANLLVMFDLPGFLVAALTAVTENVGPGMIPLDPNDIANLKSDPSYSGWTLSTGAGAVRFQGYMPVEQMRGIYQIVMFGMQTFQGMQNPQF